jgi:hypothetical protein
MSTKIDLENKDYYHQTDPQYKLRWPEELRQKIAQSAKEHNRSMNADIVARLEESFTSGLVASDPYKRMLLAVIAGVLAEQADKEKPSFEEAIDRIVKAIMTDEKTLQNMLSANNKDVDKHKPSTLPPKDNDWR